MAWEENSHICLHMQLIAILSRIEVMNAVFDVLEMVTKIKNKALCMSYYMI